MHKYRTQEHILSLLYDFHLFDFRSSFCVHRNKKPEKRNFRNRKIQTSPVKRIIPADSNSEIYYFIWKKMSEIKSFASINSETL
jgi:hypothetical protein